MSNVTVKVIRVPGAVKEIVLEEGATVGQALEAAEIEAGSGEGVTNNGAPTTMETTVIEGDRIVIAKAAKGNH